MERQAGEIESYDIIDAGSEENEDDISYCKILFIEKIKKYLHRIYNNAFTN